MTAGPVLRGTSGKLTFTPDSGSETELEIGKWDFTGEADTDRYASSKSAGFKLTEVGNKAGAGNCEGKRVTDAGKVEAVLTGLVAGVMGVFKLHFDANTGISVPAKIKSINHDVDVNAGTVQGFKCSFESHGAWSYF